MLEIVERHSLEASYLWTQRDTAADSYAHDLGSLERLDERLEAHLDGLRIAGRTGLETNLRAIARGDTSSGFAATVLAAERGETGVIASLFEQVDAHPTLGRAISAAFSWLAPSTVRSWVDRFLSKDGPTGWMGVGITVAALHRIDPGAALTVAIGSDNVLARRAAVRSAGELGRIDVRNLLEHTGCGDSDAVCRFWANWSLSLLGDTEAAGRLLAACEMGGPLAWVAASTAPRKFASDRVINTLHRLLSTVGAERPAIVAAAALGDTTMVPSLIEQMRIPRLARLSAWAFNEITGIDTGSAGLASPLPDGFDPGPSDDPADSAVAPDPEASLPFPDADRVAAHWMTRRSDFPTGTRLVLGQPATSEWLRSVLVTGRQPTRAGAALEVAIRMPGRPLFPTRAPARRQSRQLGTHGSTATGNYVAAS